jgi:hypothetical protein
LKYAASGCARQNPLMLAAGLASVTWQWRRAEAAARQWDQVTQYLSELLISARPDQHGGQWPTVLQLLQSTRETLPQRSAECRVPCSLKPARPPPLPRSAA